MKCKECYSDMAYIRNEFVYCPECGADYLYEPDKNCFYSDKIGWCSFRFIFPKGECEGCNYKQPKDFVLPDRKCEIVCNNLVEGELCKKGPCYSDGRKPLCCFKCGHFQGSCSHKCTVIPAGQ